MKKMKNVFIDSNIWLSLYHFTSDDLEQFSKLKKLKKDAIRIIIPAQTRDEVIRNRDAKIKDSVSKFERFEFQFPAFCKSYEEYQEFSHSYDELKKKHKEWCAKIRSDIAKQELPADRVIREYFDSCTIIECIPEIIQQAELRYKSGNPPGKEGKFGDAINWECLLSAIPDGEDLFFISGDKDYRSAVDDNGFNLFLAEEWSQKKHSHISFFTSLVAFIKAHVNEIDLQTEQKKEDLIKGLINSPNFQTTHAIIRSLSSYHEWNEQQIEDMCSAVVTNFQVSYIFGDDDILSFYEKILSSKTIDSESIVFVKNAIEKTKQTVITEEEDDLPF